MRGRSRDKNQKSGRRLQSSKPLPQRARRRFEQLGTESLSHFWEQRQAIEVSAMRMRIFLVTKCRPLNCADQNFPGTAVVEKTLRGSLDASDFDQGTLGPTGDLEGERSRTGRVEWARGIIVRVRREKRSEFAYFGREAFPAIAIAVVDDRTSAENLLHSWDIFPSNAENHVDKFRQAKYLLHDGADGHVAGVFLREANRDSFRQGHLEIGERLTQKEK